jgi:hypothetical protein
MHENRTIKPIEIVLKREGGRMRGMIEGVNLISVYYMHIWKSDKIPLYN